MSFIHGALIVCGSGPGVARGIATLFAERGFQKIILMSRNAERLSEDAQHVCSGSATVAVYEVPVDFGDKEQVHEGLRRVELALGETPLDCVLYNAAKTAKSAILEYPADDFRADLQVGVMCCFHHVMRMYS
jgi:NAD(P)-dependent dehydrogenase (short-subunit alcohol dehydrogenase family)